MAKTKEKEKGDAFIEGVKDREYVYGIQINASDSSSTTSSPTRRNRAGTIERTDNYTNINNGLDPFLYSSTGGNVNTREAIILCQKTYYNFSIFRNTIDFMTEFSSSELRFKGGNKKARDFFAAWLKKIGEWSLQDRFFREYYRSGNVIIYRIDSKILSEDITKMTQVFGAIEEDSKLPARYIILNPADIETGGNISFFASKFLKVLTPYEIQRLKKPQTEEEIAFYDSLPAKTKKELETGAGRIVIELSPEQIVAVFYKKQDYEPMAVPMGFPVLADINWKAEMRKMDMAATRTIQQAILLITMGAEPDKGGTNMEAMRQMQALFQNESVGRVLIADYTTNAQYIFPDVASFLDPKKYESIDRDIRTGLNNVLLGDGEKFANTSMKVQVLIERLKQGREAFLSEFLVPEIKRISKMLGFKNYPTPNFADINLKDSLEYSKIYTRLYELGLLTPEEAFEAFETGILPDRESSEENQAAFKPLKDKGYYQPIVGGPADQLELAKQKEIMKPAPVSRPGGRPKGTKRKQSTKKVKPIGANFSMSKTIENFSLANQVNQEIKEAVEKKLKGQKITSQQEELIKEVTKVIVANEEPENWLDSIPKYLEKPVDTNPERVQEILDLACEHQIDDYQAAILLASKVDESEPDNI